MHAPTLPDPATLVTLATAIALIVAITLVLVRLRYAQDIRGTGFWALGPTLWCLASVFITMHQRWPVALTQGGGNALIMLGALAYYLGSRHFFGVRTRWPDYALMGLLLVLAALPLGPGSHEDTWYLRQACLAFIAADVLNLYILLRHGNGGLPARVVDTAFAVHIVALAIRFVQISEGGGVADYLAPSLFNTLYVGAYIVVLLTLGMGAIAMLMERLASDLRHEATHDALTRALHRGALLQECARELRRSQRSGNGPALLMLDLDHFKQINDTFGHQHGDRVLAHCASQVHAQLRANDLLGRYGGEEFLVMLPQTSLVQARRAAKRIHQGLRGGHELDCTVSIGVTAWRGRADTLDVMIGRADQALYLAKSAGRDCSRWA